MTVPFYFSWVCSNGTIITAPNESRAPAQTTIMVGNPYGRDVIHHSFSQPARPPARPPARLPACLPACLLPFAAPSHSACLPPWLCSPQCPAAGCMSLTGYLSFPTSGGLAGIAGLNTTGMAGNTSGSPSTALCSKRRSIHGVGLTRYNNASALSGAAALVRIYCGLPVICPSPPPPSPPSPSLQPSPRYSVLPFS